MYYSEKEALKQLSEASSWPNFPCTGEYDHMELIDHIDGLFIDVPSRPDYFITGRLNTEFKGNSSIWYTEMKEIHGRRNWPWWKSQIIQKYSNDEESQTPHTNARRTRACSKMQMVKFKDKPSKRVSEVTKKKNSCHNCGSKDHYSNNCTKAKKKVYAIEQVPKEESPTEDSEYESMGDAIREQSDEDQNLIEEFLLEYQKETPLEIQDIQLEEGMPQDTANKKTCLNTHKMHRHS
ncbi:hypothetical protein O181_000434 [Austropuccinia psidii MF-1]|uniref:CCHC-type domain-containing protein n=1 Tax=Austropuccinia psidii MF-1 TaxID=1389203 RepID=A0A9Q3GAX5_9BASI|nr:hypothetical protein [Austropuccinia psidii MF-1]